MNKPHRAPAVMHTAAVAVLSLAATVFSLAATTASAQPPSSSSSSASVSTGRELRVAAPIVGVEPITEGGAPICDIQPPPRDAGLAATLRWDLHGRCRPNDVEATVTGYRVTYEWDGRRFNTLLAKAPKGDTLDLQLRID